MNIGWQTGSPLEREADALIVGVTAQEKQLELAGPAEELNDALGGQLVQLAADARFTGARGSRFVIPTLGRLPSRRLILAGLGSADAIDRESVRQAWGSATKGAIAAGASTVISFVPPVTEALTQAETLEAATQAVRMASYRFDKHFGTVRKEENPKQIETFSFVDPGADSVGTQSALDRGEAIGTGVNLARTLSDEPGNELTPQTMADMARQVALENGLEITVMGVEELKEMGANALLTVGKASSTDPQLIHLIYRPEDPDRSSRKIGLVGKCITFDTGGYSLKPGASMTTMKGDMSGGFAVLGAMSALRTLNVPHTVHGVICAAENMISGEAFRPDDIIVGMNGVTMEIVSTDAEGRLVLADGLVYTSRLGVDEMIDLATLTGAKVVALGDETTALFTNDDTVAERLLASAREAGEQMWRMPLSKHLEKQIKGTIGDIRNSGGRAGGSISAALFLQHFTEDTPWAHLDIAGGNLTTGNHYTPKGSTGVGVRSLLSYLTSENA